MNGTVISSSPLTLGCLADGVPVSYEVGYMKPKDQTLKSGDICLFYGSYSIVLEISNPQDPPEKQVCILETECVVTEFDRKFLKTDPDAKVGWMRHGFSCKQLTKIIDFKPDIKCDKYEILENRTRKECDALKRLDYDNCGCMNTENPPLPKCRSLTPRVVRGKIVMIEI